MLIGSFFTPVKAQKPTLVSDTSFQSSLQSQSIVYNLLITANSPQLQITVVPSVYQPPAPKVVSSPILTVNSGTHEDWMREAGIPEQDWGYVNKIVIMESGWNPNVRNREGACGLLQQLPCSKWAHQWNDPVGALIDGNDYVLARYGSWANAYYFHLKNGWY